ncbi:hypothetical protein [Caldimonas sp. KR1-144]|uniref:hypothetical protein n=1 Tax=Caldimonas sp. KR1-144 TaxID=3400911 RepID=UPI003C0DE8C5
MATTPRANEIPTGVNPDGSLRYDYTPPNPNVERDFFSETEVGRNINNAAMALPGLGSAARIPSAVRAGRAALTGLRSARTVAGGVTQTASAATLPAAALSLAGETAASPAAPPAPARSAAVTPEVPTSTPTGSAGFRRLRDGSVVGSQLDAEGRAQGIFRRGSAFGPQAYGVSVGDAGSADEALGREARANQIRQASVDAAQEASGGGGPAVGINGMRGDPTVGNIDPARAAYLAEQQMRLGGSRTARAAGAAALASVVNNAAETEARERVGMAGIQASRDNTALEARTRARLGDQATVTARRGQDLDYQASTYGADARTAIASAQLRAQQVDKADERARKRLDDTVEMFKGEFTAVDKDGKRSFDEVGARQAANALLRTAPEFSQLPPAQQRALMTQAIAEARTTQNLAQPARVGIDAINPFASEPAANIGRPSLRGGSSERVGLLRGVVTPGVSAGDYLVRDASGRSYVLPNPSVEEIDLIDRETRRGR